MNAIKRIIVAVALIIGISGAASAQFRIGPRVGIDVNSLHFNKELLNSDNRAGFTGGIQAEFTVPIVNLAFDASVMYTRRSAGTVSTGNNEITKYSRDFISIPINFKYKIGLPVVGKVFTPYIFTGPEFSFLCNKKDIAAAYKEHKVDYAWNVGIGFQIINHLQLSGSYGFGLNKAVEFTGIANNSEPITGKNGFWTVTAAWLF